MEEQNKNRQWWLHLLLYGALLLLALRFLVRLRFLLVPLLILMGMGAGGYLLLQHLRSRRRKKAYLHSVEGMIETRLKDCEEQIRHNRAQIENIQSNISELEKKWTAAGVVVPRIQEETTYLINSFGAELKLRESKLAFFETCRHKLEQILQQHRLTLELEAKKEKLKSLQATNYEDLATMEEMKTHVETEILHLDTIENLSRRISESTTYNDAERLLRELNEMNASLEKF